MRIELIPIVFGALLVLAGLLLAADAILPEGAFLAEDRRRRQRSERNRAGELSIAVGLFAMAAALIGRDTWQYSTVVVIIGVVALALGSVLNLGFLKEYLFHRGASRRGAPTGPKGARVSREVGTPAQPTRPLSGSGAIERASSASGSGKSGSGSTDRASTAPVPGTSAPARPVPGKSGPADRAPQPTEKPKMRDNRKYPRS